jgi:hypothetical protein
MGQPSGAWAGRILPILICIKRFRHNVSSAWRAESGFFLAIWLFLMLVGRSAFLNDPGTFWNTHTGQRWLAAGQLPAVDPYSCRCAGEPWVPQGSLGALFLAVLHHIGGLDALVLATATLLAFLLTWSAHRLIQTGWHWSVGVAAVWLLFTTSC